MSSRLIGQGWRLGHRVCGLYQPQVYCSSNSTNFANLYRRRSQSTLFPQKPYYVTSPIFYVNAAPHIGHLYTLILTDVLKRWHALLGRESILCTGTDEHGMKIQQAARKAGVDVRTFCDQNAQPFRELANAINVDYDHFIRTSEPEHRFAVQHFWLMLREKGWIYTSKHEGWYSVSDETFYPEGQVHLSMDPSTGRKFMASVETGKEVEWTSETNYHFKMSALKDKLLEFYKNNPKFIVPASRMTEVVQQVESGLTDLSISRPVERLTWGIPVPDDDSQTIYVWLDALINYLTKTNYPFQIPDQEQSAGWPADVHVIGKDILRFHCIYWPAFLLALDLPLPKQVLTHAHWLLGRQKMSKSVGNVVNPFFAINRFGVDGLRYFMVYDGGIQDDASYSNEYVADRYKHQLAGNLGNLISRTIRGKKWNVRQAVKDLSTRQLLESTVGSERHRALITTHWSMLIDLPNKVSNKMKDLDPSTALKMITNAISATNVYMQSAAPWDLANQGKLEEMNEVIYLCAESLRICGILLQPFMPESSKKQLDLLGVHAESRSFVNTIFASDFQYGTPLIDPGVRLQGVLFPPLPTVEFDEKGTKANRQKPQQLSNPRRKPQR